MRRRDTITNVDPTFKEPLQTRGYRVGVSQILTQEPDHWRCNYEVITDEGS